MEKINLSMGVMCWWEQACEKHGTLVSPELRKAVQHILLAMPFMQVDPTMRRLCVSAFCDFFDYDLRHVCILFYLLGKYGLRIEMSKEEMDEYEGKTAPKAETIDWERRRWELAASLFVHWSDISSFDGLTPVDIADKFIKEYKKSLKRVVSGSIAV